MQRAPYIFHAADVSYFSGKVRPALPQKSMTPDGEAWQDTSEILDLLEAAHPEPPLIPKTPLQRVVSYLIELYSDEVALLPAMHYRWSFPESERKARVDFALGSGNREAANGFADRMATGKNMLGVSDETAPAIEAHLRELLDVLSQHFEEHRFLLGDAMSLADCGLMGPFYGHLFRDAVPEKLLLDTAFRVCCWIERMNRPPREQKGWLAGDTLPGTLLPVLRVMADGVPMLLDSTETTLTWIDDNPGTPPPRAVGLYETPYRDTQLRLLCRPYSLWMVQRLLDAVARLDATERGHVDAALADTGWAPLLALQPRHRIGKKRNELVVER
jgi:glutathione S-transferase